MIALLETLLHLLPSTLMIAAPILIAAVGGMICERSGIVNIALEGLMTLGAMIAAASHVFMEKALNPAADGTANLSIVLALVLAVLGGALFSAIHAFASITLKADQVISGTGINLLANGLTVFFCQLLFRMDRTMSPRMGMMPGPGGIYPTAWLGLAILAAAWFLLFKRPWGLRLRACGEHPQAAASAGVNVKRMRRAAVLISGALAGLAGGCVVLTQDIQFTASTINGKGFIALAAVSFGRWLPRGILGASFLFGLSSALAVNIFGVQALRFLPPELFNALPYLITLLTLVFFSGRDYAPRAAGKTGE